MSAATARALLAAADVLERRGLHRGGFGPYLVEGVPIGDRRAGSVVNPDRCRVCLYGAIGVVTAGHPAGVGLGTVAARRAIDGVCRRTFGVTAPEYGDLLTTTTGDAVAALRSAAAELATSGDRGASGVSTVTGARDFAWSA